MKKRLLVSVLILSLFSCDRDEKDVKLSGKYSEITPVANRTQIDFQSNNSLVIIKSGNSDKFTYQIEGNKIKLRTDGGYNGIFEFEKINTNEFKIENLYPSIPENPKTYMSFRK